MMHLADTHSFGEGQRADASFERPQADDLQGGQTDAVPDPDVRLQRLNTTNRGRRHVSLHLPSTNCSLPPPITHHFLLPVTPTTCFMSPPTPCIPSPPTSCALTRPSLSTPAIWPVAIRILSGWRAKLERRAPVTTEQPIGAQKPSHVTYHLTQSVCPR